MKVCIAEKPSVAKEIAQILGANSRKEGYFEGNNYQVTWTFGHLCTLKEPNDYEPGLKRWSLFSLPIIPQRFGIKTIPDQGIERQFKVIEKLIGQAVEVINCGDAGQEGELIQRWVLQKANCKAPIKRLWISSLTEEAIKEGFKKLKPASDFDRLYYAGSSRAVGDWLLGINATRLFTLKYGQGNNVLSIGRVQTPTLAMIVDRFKEVDNFAPMPFWEVKTKYRDVVFNSNIGKQNSKDSALSVVQKIENSTFTVQSFTQKEGKENAPKLFDLTSLQVECNKKINLTAETTLKIAQKLYEGKYITYPRVDTRFLPDDIYPSIEGIFRSMVGFSKLTEVVLSQPIKKSKQVFNNTKVTDHHAIIPTNISPGNLPESEKAVYDIIAKRFIANFYPECKVSKTQVIGLVEDVEFKATGKEILSPGWKVVYGNESTDENDDANTKGKEDTQLLPNFTEGESGPHAPLCDEKVTSPPKLFTEGTLLRAMETAGKQVQDESLRELMKENGIGRPSTRANIIETLFRRKYIAKQKKNIIPTITGIQLIETINVDVLKSAELTGDWEQKLRKIENGEYDVSSFMTELKNMVQGLVSEVKNQSTSSKIEVDAIPKLKPKTAVKKISCPKCDSGSVVTGKSAHGCDNFKNGCDFRIPTEIRGKKISLSIVKSLITKKKSNLVKGIQTKEGKKDGYLTFKEDFSLGFEVHVDKPLICPSCKKNEVVKGQKAFGCKGYNQGCRFMVPFDFMGKTIGSKQIEQLVLKGKTGVVKGVNSGNNDSATGHFQLNQAFAIEFIAKNES